MTDERNYWRKCSTCKKEIKFQAIYQICSVSTCKKSAYCSVDCWDIHLPVMNHKSAWAEEMVAPTKADYEKEVENSSTRAPRRIIVNPKSENINNSVNGNISEFSDSGSYDRDILIVASKLKKYVKDRYGLNTSSNVMEKLSDIVRDVCNDAARQAFSEERKTLMDRDFK